MCCEGIYAPLLSFFQDLEKWFLYTVDIVKLISKKLKYMLCKRDVIASANTDWQKIDNKHSYYNKGVDLCDHWLIFFYFQQLQIHLCA